MIFRKLYDNEIEMVARVHSDVVRLLLSKNIRQWMNPIPISAFEEKQKRGENFGLFDEEGNFLAYASILIKGRPSEWESALENYKEKLYWLSSIFVNPRKKIEGVGKALLENCLFYFESLGVETVFLDCVVNEGFLVNYYQGFGFSILDEKMVQYRSGQFKMALMKKDITNEQ